MRAVFLSVVALVAVLVVGVFTARAVAWKRHTDKRTFYAEQAGAYLFAPSGVVLKATGESLTRQQLLDYLLHQTIEKNPELAFTK